MGKVMPASSCLPPFSRRRFLGRTARLTAAAALPGVAAALAAQVPGDRPARAAGLQVLHPAGRVPVGLLIDDSTCLVNLNRFAMPQFDAAFQRRNPTYHRDWKSWPVEIPDAFVRRFGEWCAAHGVKGKYSVVPFPACVGRLDRELPGWSGRDLEDSLRLVREELTPHWDIHPEMVTHTRVIDLATGHPYPDPSLRFMENWDWTTGRSVDELAAYHAYALQILKNVGLPCEGLTTPGGYGNRALPELAQATLEALRAVFQAEIPHYFRHLYTDESSVAPRVEYARDLDSNDPRCVVSIIGCTGDWTGGWDNTEPEGADRFITADLQQGRLVDVITRGEPAMMVCHWTGIYWNGEEKGFKVFQEVVRRLHARFDHLIWMKPSELARYAAARELTRLERTGNTCSFKAPFACPRFTVRIEWPRQTAGRVTAEGQPALRQVEDARHLQSGTWCQRHDGLLVCFDLPRGASRIVVHPA